LSKYGLLGSNDFKNAIITELEVLEEDNVAALIEKGEYDEAYDIMEENGDLEAIADNKCERAKELQDAGDKDAADKLFGEAFYEYMHLSNCAKKAEEVFSNSGMWVKSGRGFQIKVPAGYYESANTNEEDVHRIHLKNRIDDVWILYSVYTDKNWGSAQEIFEYHRGDQAELKTINNTQVCTIYTETENVPQYLMAWVPEEGKTSIVAVAGRTADKVYLKKLSEMIFGTLSSETDQILYDNPNCYVVAYDVVDEDLSDGLYINLLLENRKSNTLRFSVEDAWINGVEIAPSWGYELVKGNYTLDTKFRWSSLKLKNNGIEKIDEIRLLFTVTDSSTKAVIHQDILYIAP